MKQNHRCPKCGSTDLIADATPLARTDLDPTSEMRIATYRKPEALLFKGQQSSNLSAWVCGGCGYVEFYAHKPDALKSPKA